jgi:hypothetical protein
MDEPVGEYTARNYSAVDHQIHEIARREAALTNRMRLENFKRFALASLVFACALGLLIISIGIAIRLMNPPPLIVSEDPRKLDITVRNEPLTIRVDGDRGSKLNILSPPPSSMFDPPTNNVENGGIGSPTRLNPDSPTMAPPPSPKVGITKFLSSKSGINGYNDVVSGWKYENSNREEPLFQYCYIQKSGEGILEASVTLAQKSGEDKIVELFTPHVANQAGLSKFEWDSARTKCQWFLR